MMVSRLLLATTLAFCVAPRSDAQRIAPVAPVALRSADAEPGDAVSYSEVISTASIPAASPVARLAPSAGATAQAGSASRFSPAGTIVGGVVGGGLGLAAGFFVGAMAAEGCNGEDCGLVPALVGGAIGETIGLAVGAHVGSRSSRHENILTSSLASAGVALLGGLAAIPTNGAALFLVPVGQLAAAYMIESGSR